MTLAREYFSRVLSPWVPGVNNPITTWVTELARPKGLAVDVGCGPGVLLCVLAQHFGRVVAIDQDRDMVEAAGELLEKLRGQGATFGEVELRCQDWAECDDIRGADLVCAVNSILEPDAERRRRMFSLLGDSLKRGEGPDAGTLLAIFPAMEAQVHLLRLFADELARLGASTEVVTRQIETEFLTAHHFDAFEGTFASRGDEPQKFYYELELGWELADVGFDVRNTSQVIYPWEVCREVDAGYFPGEVELFDWFVWGQARTG